MSEYKVGQMVEVRGHGHWYVGQVIKIGRTRVTVRYTTGSGATHEKAARPSLIRLPERS